MTESGTCNHTNSPFFCDDMLGNNFTFIEDRVVGKQKLVKMVESQILYLKFLMSKLPVDTKPYGGFKYRSDKLTSADVGCIPADNEHAVIVDAKHELAAKFFLLGIDVTSQSPPKYRTNASSSFQTGDVEGLIKNSTAESIVDLMIKTPLSESELGQRALFFKTEYDDKNKYNTFEKRTNPRWIAFPMGNQVPLRLTPLSLADIIPRQFYYEYQKSTGSLEDEKDYEGQTDEQIDKLVKDANMGKQKSKTFVWRSSQYPRPLNMYQHLLDAAEYPECLRYKQVADFPYEAFGWKTDAQGNATTDLFINDLFNQYLRYLGNPDMSFSIFQNNIPKDIPLGESGNPVPVKCMYGDCPLWLNEGFGSYEEWVEFTNINQSSNLTEKDALLVNSIDIDTEFEVFYEKSFVDYSKNPEFMPNYAEVPVWKFSNSCFDNPNFMGISMGEKSKEWFFFNEKSYNYIVSILVKTTFEKFVKDVDDKLKINLVVTKNILEQVKEAKSNIQSLFDSVKTFFLLPEDKITDDKKVTLITQEERETYLNKINDIYNTAITNINQFDRIAEYNEHYNDFKNCIEKQRNKIEGIPMTQTQREKYKINLDRLLYSDWTKKAREDFNKYEGDIHSIKDEQDWIASHPVANWFRVNVLNLLIVPIMDNADSV
jgi:hypothetical protein